MWFLCKDWLSSVEDNSMEALMTSYDDCRLDRLVCGCAINALEHG